MRLIDICLFYDEASLVRLRCDLYREISGLTHVYVELDHSYSGIPRESGFPIEVLKRDNVKHLFVPVPAAILHKNDPWAVESFHRDICADLMRHYPYRHDSVFMLSDIDEFPSISTLQLLITRPISSISTVLMEWFWLSLEWSFPTNWRGTVVFNTISFFSSSLSQTRVDRSSLPSIGSGLHISYFMPPCGLRNKLKSFSHSRDLRIRYYNTDLISYVSLYQINPFKPFYHPESRLVNLTLNQFREPHAREKSLILKYFPLNPRQYSRSRPLLYNYLFLAIKYIVFEIAIWPCHRLAYKLLYMR